jgi:hypothetical protein
MTERLRDIVASDDPAVADLVRMVRATGDLAPRPGAKDRVRRALAERPLARRPPRWQAAVVAALVLCIVLPAAIAGVRWLVELPVPRPAPAPVPAPVVAPAVPGPPRGHHRPVTADVPSVPDLPDAEDATIAVPAVPPAGTGSAGELAPASPAAVPVPPSAGSGAAAPRFEPVTPVTPAPLPPVRELPALPPPASERRPHLPGRVAATAPAAAAPDAEAPAASSTTGAPARAASRPPAEVATAVPAADTALVVDAMRRLRRGRDPRSALPQLDAYLTRFPDGDLAEEVRALAIEAHAALGDAAACSLAEQYLQRYPHGRFRDPAERIARRCP